MSTLIERKKRKKWRRIKNSAAALFAEQGFEATTTRQIARRAEVAVGTLYLYAKTKEALAARLFREEIEGAVEQAFASLPDAALVDQLVHVFGRLFAFYAQDLALARVLVQQATLGATQSEDNVAFTMTFVERLGGLFTDAAERDELRQDLPPVLAATNAFASYLLALVGWLGGTTDPKTRDSMLRASLQLQIDGLKGTAP